MPGPWDKYAQQAAPADPVIAPADPYKQAAEERAQSAEEREVAAAERAAAAAGRPPAAPSGYRYRPDGGLEFIPGGPADPAVSDAKPGKALRQGDSDKLRSAINQFASFTNLNDTFTDDFGGNLLGGLENTAQGYSPIPVGTPGQRDWWAGLHEIDNLIRNDLFGASLTQGEKQAYARTTVTPGMNSTEIRRNMGRREEIMRAALTRYVNGLKAGGWSEQEIDALMGEVTPRIFPGQGAPEAERRDDDAPPALGGAAAPPSADPGPGATPAPPILGPLVNSEGQIAGSVHDNGDNPAMGIARGETRREDNPILAGVRDEYLSRLERGDSAEQLIRWAREVGVHPSAYGSISAQAKFRREHPEIALTEYDTSELDDRFIPLTQAERQSAADVDTSVGAFLVNAGDAASGFTLDNIVGLGGGNAERARLGMGEIADRHPVASMAGTIAGGTLVALGGEAALGARGVAAGLPRALAADTAYGAAAGAGGTDDGSNRLLGAGKGALAGAGGSLAGYGAGNVLARAARGVADPSVNALRSEGVNALTMGQTYGNLGRVGEALKGAEDRLSGFPVVGDMVNSRRAEGVRQFNSRAFDKALEPIGGTVGDLVGEEAVERAQQQVSQAFTTALAGKGAVPDQAFARDLSSAVLGVRSIKRIGDELDDEVADILEPYMQGTILSGEALDDISRNLRDLKGRYVTDPLGVRAAKQIDRVERAIFDLFDRQASGTIPEYMAARQAYRRLSVLEDSVLKARNQKDRIFTAAQLGQADRANAKKFGGKRAAARGDTPFHDYSNAGQDVLPNQVPDSGTAGRMLVPLVLVGAGGTSDATGLTDGLGITIGSILAGLYSRAGQRLLTKPGRGMKAGTRRRRVLESSATRRALAATGAAGTAAALIGPE